MSPEEAAAYFAMHRDEFRKLEEIRCPHCTKGRVLAGLFAHQSGNRLLWIAPRQGIDQDGRTIKVPARAVDPDEPGFYIELTECGRCRTGAMLTVQDGRTVVRRSDPPTRGRIAP